MPGTTKKFRPIRNAPRKLEELNIQQKLFVHEYLRDLNASKAAERAGYSSKMSGKLLDNKAIQRELGLQMGKRTMEADIDAARVLKELKYIALFDPIDIFDEAGIERPIHRLPEHIRRAIKKVRVAYDKEGNAVTRFEFYDKIEALNSIGKHIGMFIDRVKMEHSLSQDVINQLLELAAVCSMKQTLIKPVAAGHIEDKTISPLAQMMNDANTIDGLVVDHQSEPVA